MRKWKWSIRGVTADGKYVKLVSTQTEQDNGIWKYAYVEKITGSAGRELVNEYSVAVDKKVISLGSILCIDGYDERRADDIGSRVKGNHIDLFRLVTKKEAREFGVKTDIDVYKQIAN